MTLQQISSAVYNSVVGGLTGITSNPKISIEQLEDEVVAERNQVMREYLLKGVLTLDELFLAINCVEVNCDYMSKCCELQIGEKALHFEIPPIIYIKGEIIYINCIFHNAKATIEHPFACIMRACQIHIRIFIYSVFINLVD